MAFHTLSLRFIFDIFLKSFRKFCLDILPKYILIDKKKRVKRVYQAFVQRKLLLAHAVAINKVPSF